MDMTALTRREEINPVSTDPALFHHIRCGSLGHLDELRTERRDSLQPDSIAINAVPTAAYSIFGGFDGDAIRGHQDTLC
jgi:hypothetical protein